MRSVGIFCEKQSSKTAVSGNDRKLPNVLKLEREELEKSVYPGNLKEEIFTIAYFVRYATLMKVKVLKLEATW